VPQQVALASDCGKVSLIEHPSNKVGGMAGAPVVIEFVVILSLQKFHRDHQSSARQ
jgi:hypothetical protein